ncbi:MAG: 1-acyl-sn-glycerol-3-phosphate acyltransferase [Deltaproteobacteria bacterium]|nr:1-acyl-sn-glycerol-3-phosphate acyltransferase [Deltaproteobacteria bacterium]
MTPERDSPPVTSETRAGRGLRLVLDLLVTVVMWGWFIWGYFFVFFPLHVVGWTVVRERELWSQRVNHWFYRSFFGLLSLLNPLQSVRIDPKVRRLAGCVVVCNHVSYLDPLLLVAAFPRQKTVVKGTFFAAPFLGWAMFASGYLPSGSEGPLSGRLARLVERLPAFLEQGGNLFVFPEGTRRNAGGIGPLKRGAFSLARRCKAPIAVLALSGTDRLFPPGSVLLRTWRRIDLDVRLVEVITPDYDSPDFSPVALIEQVRSRMEAARRADFAWVSRE